MPVVLIAKLEVRHYTDWDIPARQSSSFLDILK
jgi:hypothetical protein